MGRSLKTLAAVIANRSGFLNSYGLLRRKLTESQVAIVLYHRVCPRGDNWSLKPLSPGSFERQMEYFSHNYEILPLDTLVQYVRQGRTLPEKAVVITFDDGYKDNYLYAYPILRKHHVPATIFLTTGHIGRGKLFWFDEVRYAIHQATAGELELDELGTYSLRSELERTRAELSITERLKQLPEDHKNVLIRELLSMCEVDIPADLGLKLILSWDEVREMHDDGFVFGAHSVNHPVLTNLPLEEAKGEIVQSKKDIEEKLGQPVTAFSYPNGDFNPEIIELIKDDFICAVAAGMPKLITSKDNPYHLDRLGATEDFGKFKVMLSGLYSDLRLSRFLK